MLPAVDHARRRDAAERAARVSGARQPGRQRGRWRRRAATSPQHGNVRGPTQQSEGDVEAALAGSALKVSGTFRTQVQTHSPMETARHRRRLEAGRAHRLRLDAGHARPCATSSRPCSTSRSPRSASSCEFMGGGFGAKFGAGHFGVVAVELSRRARAPVRLDPRSPRAARRRRQPAEHAASSSRSARRATAARRDRSRQRTARAGSRPAPASAGPRSGCIPRRGHPHAAVRRVHARRPRGRVPRARHAAGRVRARPARSTSSPSGSASTRSRCATGSTSTSATAQATAPDRVARRLERRIGADKIGWARRGTHRRRARGRSRPASASARRCGAASSTWTRRARSASRATARCSSARR